MNEHKDMIVSSAYLYTKYKEQKPFIPGVDLVPCSGPSIYPEDTATLVSAVLDGWFTEGDYSMEFMAKLENACGKRLASLCNSGSSANLLSVMGLKNYCNRHGRYIVTAATAFPTTVYPIIQSGYIPLFIDTALYTLNSRTEEILEALQKDDVDGIILAHTLGFPFNAEAVAEECHRLKKFFIEDCSDALGALWAGRPVGSFGDACTLSFFPAHQITTGEGGAVLVDSLTLFRIINSYRDWGRACYCRPGESDSCNNRFGFGYGDLPFGWDHKYTYTHLGYNLKMTELQAALGSSQLDHLDDFLLNRSINFMSLYNWIDDWKEYIFSVEFEPQSFPSPFGFPIIVRKDAPFTAKEMVLFLEDHKVATRPVFAGNITLHPFIRDYDYEIFNNLDGSDSIMNQVFWVGCHPALSEERINYIKEICEKFFNGVNTLHGKSIS